MAEEALLKTVSSQALSFFPFKKALSIKTKLVFFPRVMNYDRG